MDIDLKKIEDIKSILNFNKKQTNKLKCFTSHDDNDISGNTYSSWKKIQINDITKALKITFELKNT